MSRHVDLLVLGGGPAGATVAALCATAGLRVTLLERGRFPREKVCGEFLSAEGCGVLGRLGLLRDLIDAGAVWLPAGRILSPGGTALDFELPRLSGVRGGLGVSRARLDAALVDLARDRGVDVLERTEGCAPIVVDGSVRGVWARDVGRLSQRAIHAPLVVAADGRRSMLVRALHPRRGDPRRSRPRSWFGLATHLPLEQLQPEPRVELHLFDGGYCGLAPIEGRRINVCLLATVAALRACGGSPARLFGERIAPLPGVRAVIGGPARSHPWHSVGPLRFGVRRAENAGALFVGDAAGTVDPFCGEGMSNALCAAELAAGHAIDAVAAGGLSRAAAGAYRREWMELLAPVTRRVRWQGRLLQNGAIAEPVMRLLGGVARGALPRLIAASRTGA